MSSRHIVIILILISVPLITIPVIQSVNAITVSEIERKLSQAKTEEDVKQVIQEIVESREYREACRELYNKLQAIGPIETQKQGEKALPILQDYETLACRGTENYWQDPPDPPEHYSQEQCNELISEFDILNKKYLLSYREALWDAHLEGEDSPRTFLSPEHYNSAERIGELENEFHKYCLPIKEQECKSMKEELDIAYAEYRKLQPRTLDERLGATDFNFIDSNYQFKCNFKSSIMKHYEFMEKYHNVPIPTVISSSGIICGEGTIRNEKGQCVPERATMTTEMQQKSSGGGCLIATATFGSELAPQVQQLRELRDDTLLQTQSGSAFMSGFNEFYYSFSPTIADWERQNPVFKETVRLAITPLITSLSILNYVDMDSEAEVLGYGIGIILLNIGMYFVIPAIVTIEIRKKQRIIELYRKKLKD